MQETYLNGGRFTSRGEWIHPTRTIDSFELIVMAEGEAWIREEDREYALSVGDVLLLEPEKSHGGFAPSTKRVSFYWLHFQGFSFSDHMGMEKKQTLTDPYAVTLLCRQLLSYAQRGFEGSVTDSFLHILLAELEAQGRATEGSELSAVQRVEEWIRINSDYSLTVGEVAARFGYHPDYLSRLFRRYRGKGLKSIIDEKRLHEIKRMLLESEWTLMQIADRVGMQDYKLFLKFFKYHEGITPTEFRRLYQAMHTNNR